MSIYEEFGYDNREDYLRSVAIDHNVPITVVREIAKLLGKSEDFDELISSIEHFKAL